MYSFSFEPSLRQTDYFFNSLRPYCSPVSLLFFRPSSNPL